MRIKNKNLNNQKNSIKGKEGEKDQSDDEIMAFNASVSVKKVMKDYKGDFSADIF